MSETEVLKRYECYLKELFYERCKIQEHLAEVNRQIEELQEWSRQIIDDMVSETTRGLLV